MSEGPLPPDAIIEGTIEIWVVLRETGQRQVMARWRGNIGSIEALGAIEMAKDLLMTEVTRMEAEDDLEEDGGDGFYG